MSEKLKDRYWDEFGEKYLSGDIFSFYPETKIIPAYLLEHFSQSEIVLDLGFGTGLWFWASFLPKLARLDGIDLNAEALEAADRILQQGRVPESYSVVHRSLGREFTANDLALLASKRGEFFFFDYTKPWPATIHREHYDLITEHGGGLGEMKSQEEVTASLQNCADILKTEGYLFFANFQKKSCSSSASFCLDKEILYEGIRKAGLKMIDFQTAALQEEDSPFQKLFYGHARK